MLKSITCTCGHTLTFFEGVLPLCMQCTLCGRFLKEPYHTSHEWNIKSNPQNKTIYKQCSQCGRVEKTNSIDNSTYVNLSCRLMECIHNRDSLCTSTTLQIEITSKEQMKCYSYREKL